MHITWIQSQSDRQSRHQGKQPFEKSVVPSILQPVTEEAELRL